MSFLKKMFGKKDPIDEMRELHARKDWVSLLNVIKRVDQTALDAELQAEVTAWKNAASDALATTNLEEGLWAHKSGNLLRAREDFQLAIEQAHTESLREAAQQALATLEEGGALAEEDASEDGPALHAGCNTGCGPSCGPTDASDVADDDIGLDEEARMELLLATLPPDLAQRYAEAGTEFKQAWLASQDGEDQLAQEHLAKVPESERNALFLFERGALKARSGQPAKAADDLRAALTAEPGLFPAFDTLVGVMAATGQREKLALLLKQNIAAEQFTGYCWARLAELHAQRGEAEPALAAGLKSLEEGLVDPGILTMCAQLLERSERFDEAEALLMQMPGGGCGGGAHPMLAEFWVRRGQKLGSALESFKGAMRQERDNPRWLLRIAQVYLAKGWKKEATEQIEQLMQQGGLPEEILAEVKIAAEACRND